MEKAVEDILKYLKVDLNDPNFVDTPARFKKVLEEIALPNEKEPPQLKTFPLEGEKGDLIYTGGLSAASLCPHHLLLYVIEASFAYIPSDRLVGLSKPGRLLRWLCGRLILQEVIGPAFIKEFDKVVNPLGSIILIKGVHLCNVARGARQESSSTITISSSGFFKSDSTKRQEFLTLVEMK